MSFQPYWSGWLSETNVRTLFPQLVEPILDFSHETPTQEDTPMSVSSHEQEQEVQQEVRVVENELENEPNNVHSQRVAPKGVLTEVTPPNFVSPQSAKYEGVDIHGLPSRMVRLKTAATKGGKQVVLVPLVILNKNNKTDAQPKMEETPLENAQELSPSPQPGSLIMQRITVPPQQEFPFYDPSIMTVRVENPDKFSDVLVRVVEKHSGPIRATVSQVLPLYERQAEELYCDPRLLLVKFYSMEDMPSNMEQVQTKTTSASPVQASTSQPIPAVPSHVRAETETVVTTQASPVQAFESVRKRARRTEAVTPPLIDLTEIVVTPQASPVQAFESNDKSIEASPVKGLANQLGSLKAGPIQSTGASPVKGLASQLVSLKAGPIHAVPSQLDLTHAAASNVLPTEGRPKRAAALKAALKRLEASKKKKMPRPVPPVSPQVTPNPVIPSGSLIPRVILVRIEDIPGSPYAHIMKRYNYVIPSTSRGIIDQHISQEDIHEGKFLMVFDNSIEILHFLFGFSFLLFSI